MIPDPGANDIPTEDRSSALAFAKKAISYFVPNKLVSWNALANSSVGNPTKSIAANSLMKIVKKKEVRRQGKPSQARKPFTKDIYIYIYIYMNMLCKMDSYGDDQVRLFVSSIFRLQMAMIGRIDNTSKFERK